MILFYFIYRLFKRFPILMLFMYVIQMGVDDVKLKNKFEESEEIEYIEHLTIEDEIFINQSFEIVENLFVHKNTFVVYISKLYQQKFITTIFHKLYILYSQLTIGEHCHSILKLN